MGKEIWKFTLVLLALAILVIGAVMLSDRLAEAHVQIYPHMHPHVETSSWEDLTADLAWLALGVAAWLGLMGLGAYLDRRIGK